MHQIREEKYFKKNFKNDYSLRDLWGNIKWIRIYIIGVTEKEEIKKGAKTYLNK